MKAIYYTLILVLASNWLFAQTLYTRTDTIAITTDSVTLKTGEHRGIIQWQRSLNGTTWEDLLNETDSIFKFKADKQAFYRAKITDGTCTPTYSDTAAVVSDTIKPATVTSPEEITGTNLVERDDSIFTFLTTSAAAIPVNTVFVSSDHESDIRVVSSVVQNGDTLKVSTQPGTMEDLFFNQEFSLSTEVVEQTTKSSYTTKAALAKSTIDGKGVIHPVQVIDNNPSLKSAQSTNESLPTVNFNYDFSGLELWKEGGASISVSEGSFKLGTELRYEFKFDPASFDWSNLKLSKGKLTRCRIYTNLENTGIDSKIVLTASSNYERSFDEEIPIKEDVFNKSFFYLIPPYATPFWANIKIDLMAKAVGEFKSAASVSGGVTSAAHFSVGASYENGAWEKIQSSTASLTLEGPTVDGHINMERRVEVYPRIEIEFYSLVSPSLEIAPYVEDKMECSTKGNFNYGLYSGVDARVAVNVGVLGGSLLECKFPKFQLKRDTLYEAPKKLEIVSGNNQTAAAGDTLKEPIVLRVLDSKDIPVTNALVHFKSILGNLFKKESSSAADNSELKSVMLSSADDSELSITSDSTGQVAVNYVVADTTAKQNIESYMKNGKDTIIEETRTTINTEAETCGCDTTKFEYFTDSRDGQVYKTIKIGDQTWMAENLAYLPNVNPSSVGYDTITPYCYVYDYEGTDISFAKLTANYKSYGVLYNWPAAIKACPSGWHLPNKLEFSELITFLGGAEQADSKLKETGMKHWNNPNSTSNNESCFTALPGGYRYHPGVFSNIKSLGLWWSSSLSTMSGTACELRISSVYNTAIACGHAKRSGCSVRCIKD